MFNFFLDVLLFLCARSIFMQDFINIFNQILYLIKKTIWKNVYSLEKFNLVFFLLKFEYFGMYFRINITDPIFFPYISKIHATFNFWLKVWYPKICQWLLDFQSFFRTKRSFENLLGILWVFFIISFISTI